MLLCRPLLIYHVMHTDTCNKPHTLRDAVTGRNRNRNVCKKSQPVIGLYRDVWIAAIASSRKSLATQTAAICVRFRGRRVRHVYVTMQITFLARKSALIYRRGLRQRVASLTIDCNGVFAIRVYGFPYHRSLTVHHAINRWRCECFKFCDLFSIIEFGSKSVELWELWQPTPKCGTVWWRRNSY